MKRIILILLSLLIIINLSACSKTNDKEVENSVYPLGYELSLGYNLPDITFEDEYTNWDLSDNYFGGKKVDEAYISSNAYMPRIAIYRFSVNEANDVVDAANKDLSKYSYDLTQNSYVTCFEDDYEYAYYSCFKTINNQIYYAQEYFYKGSLEYVNLEYLLLTDTLNIDDTKVKMNIPSSYYGNSSEDYISIFTDDTNTLPSIYISKTNINENINQEVQAYIEPEIDYNIDFDSLEYNPEPSEEIYSEENQVNAYEELQKYLYNMYDVLEIDNYELSKFDNGVDQLDYLKLNYHYQVDDQDLLANEYSYIDNNYLYTICICSYLDNDKQIENASIISSSISLN